MSRIVVIAMFAAMALTEVRGADSQPLDALLLRGQQEVRAGQFSEAVADLNAAADALLSSGARDAYVSTGRLEVLPQLETALVYLIVAYDALGRSADVAETIERLAAADRIQPTYAALPLTADVAAIDGIIARFAPATLPPNAVLAQVSSSSPVTGSATAMASQPIIVSSQSGAGVSSSIVIAPGSPAPLAATRAAMLRAIERTDRSDCSEIERAADRRIAEAHRAAELRVAEAQAAQKAAEEAMAAAKAESERRAVREREARAEVEGRIAAEQEQSERASRRVLDDGTASGREIINRLREAESLAATGRTAEASETYARVATSPAASREAIAAAAAGLYRTGDFESAVAAFQRLMPFARGEEDLRYYDSVSLYETGRYEEARRQLACAIPYIEITADVDRYRSKIENTAPQQGMR